MIGKYSIKALPKIVNPEGFEKALNTMTEREKKIIKRRMHGDTRRELSKFFGISYERIRQIEMKSIRKLLQPVLKILYTINVEEKA